jgi:hypothetical protein
VVHAPPGHQQAPGVELLLVCNQRVLLIKAVTAPERQTMKVLSTNPDGLQIGNSPNHQQIQNPRTMGQTQMVAPNPTNQNLQWSRGPKTLKLSQG